jgi:hypothetical protein
MFLEGATVRFRGLLSSFPAGENQAHVSVRPKACIGILPPVFPAGMGKLLSKWGAKWMIKKLPDGGKENMP